MKLEGHGIVVREQESRDAVPLAQYEKKLKS